MSFPKQVNLGPSGLKISPVVVGCMSFGTKNWLPWVVEDKEEIFKTLKYCYDVGLRTFDTADFYGNGLTERILGEFLRKYQIKRETVVILSKIYFPVDESFELPFSSIFHTDPGTALSLTNQRGLSRKHIIDGVGKSVERLGTYIDVLQIHRFDHETPMEETMRALNDVVEMGHCRYIGASSMLATEFVELQFIAQKHSWFQFINTQSCYNLLYREDERELIPFVKRHKLGFLAWSPNARGLLTRPVGFETTRFLADPRFRKQDPVDEEIINRVQQIAEKRRVSMATVSTAWVLSKGCNPIVGMSSIDRVDDALKAITFQLSEKETSFLEEPYKPKRYE